MLLDESGPSAAEIEDLSGPWTLSRSHQTTYSFLIEILVL